MRLIVRRSVLVVALLLGLRPPAFAQTATVLEGSYAKESLTVSTVAVTLTVATYAPSGAPRVARASLQVEGCAVRAWSTGDTPTATVGQKFNVGDFVEVVGVKDIQNFKAIRDTTCSGDATLQIVYSR